MTLKFTIHSVEKLALRDPESSALGKRIVRSGIELMYELGYENFTFKKLAEKIGTTEASIYRYFENKHKLLLYFLTWYWNFVEYLVVVSLQNLADPKQKIQKVIEILTHELPGWSDAEGMDRKMLHQIVIAESSKVYLIKEVDSINRDLQVFKPYKDLCARIAGLFLEMNPKFEFPRSLASTLVEMAQFQSFFMEHLPSLTDFGERRSAEAVAAFLEKLVFSSLEKA